MFGFLQRFCWLFLTFFNKRFSFFEKINLAFLVCSVATAVFLLDLGFFCFIWVSGVFCNYLGFFDSSQILEMYVVLLYFPFKNTMPGTEPINTTGMRTVAHDAQRLSLHNAASIIAHSHYLAVTYNSLYKAKWQGTRLQKRYCSWQFSLSRNTDISTMVNETNFQPNHLQKTAKKSQTANQATRNTVKFLKFDCKTANLATLQHTTVHQCCHSVKKKTPEKNKKKQTELEKHATGTCT